RVATRLQMPPLQLEDEILIHFQGPQLPDGLTGTVNHPVLHRPRIRTAVNITPTVEGFAVEDGPEAIFGEAILGKEK
ncbi:MAG: hypothetical protein QGG09_17545, partial [Pirellulaceae bacterium]|nr:hypothetical protein [Pirellulaceae bacterium]